mmetsp:Transcript_45728/g.58723  ORF Transcript_45728/g.58723 Transcript_45728/m.58723 type:complete len:114 (+) Transcript_45728:785-1126(+)
MTSKSNLSESLFKISQMKTSQVLASLKEAKIACCRTVELLNVESYLDQHTTSNLHKAPVKSNIGPLPLKPYNFTFTATAASSSGVGGRMKAKTTIGLVVLILLFIRLCLGSTP